MRSPVAKIEKELLGGGASSVKRYQKTNGAKRLLAASRVGGVVTGQELLVSPDVELMRKHILTEYERDVFSGEVCLRPGQEHLSSVVRSGWGLLSLTYTRTLKPNR